MLIVEIYNKLPKDILIDPSLFYYNKSMLTESGSSSNNNYRIFAVDPGRRIDEIDLQISEEEAEYKSKRNADAAIGCLGAGLNIAGMAAGKDNDDLIDLDEHTDDMEREEARYNRKIL